MDSIDYIIDVLSLGGVTSDDVFPVARELVAAATTDGAENIPAIWDILQDDLQLLHDLDDIV